MRISDLSSDVCSSDLREAARQKELLAEGISSQNKYDQAVLAAQNARSAILNTRQANPSVAAQLTGSVDAPIARQPAFAQAQPALARARLNRGYTVVRAAHAGIVAQVDQLPTGNSVTTGKPGIHTARTPTEVEAKF